MPNGVMLWPLYTPVHCEYLSLYNVTHFVVSCYGPYILLHIVNTSVCIM